MALPTIKKTWQYFHYVGTPSGIDYATDVEAMMFAVKEQLKSWGSGAWTVVGSGDNTTGALDGNDRLVDVATMYAHPNSNWLLLQNAGFGQICLVPGNPNSGYTMHYWVSIKSAFSGGNASTRPTAPDEFDLLANSGANIGSSYGGSGTGVFVCHMMQSTDGQCTRLLFGSSLVFNQIYCFETLDMAVPGMTYPKFATTARFTQNSNLRDYPLMFINNAGQIMDDPGNQNIQFLLECITQGNDPFTYVNGANEISGEMPLIDMYIGCGRSGNVTSSGHPVQRGFYGKVFDVWFTANTVGTGDGFPSDGSRQLIGCHAPAGSTTTMVLPWDGTALVMG